MSAYSPGDEVVFTRSVGGAHKGDAGVVVEGDSWDYDWLIRDKDGRCIAVWVTEIEPAA